MFVVVDTIGCCRLKAQAAARNAAKKTPNESNLTDTDSASTSPSTGGVDKVSEQDNVQRELTEEEIEAEERRARTARLVLFNQ